MGAGSTKRPGKLLFKNLGTIDFSLIFLQQSRGLSRKNPPANINQQSLIPIPQPTSGSTVANQLLTSELPRQQVASVLSRPIEREPSMVPYPFEADEGGLELIPPPDPKSDRAYSILEIEMPCIS